MAPWKRRLGNHGANRQIELVAPKRSHLVTTRREFLALCESLRSRDCVAIDTEFIPERTYTPELCLVQIATHDQAVAVDPLAVGDMLPFWDAIVSLEGQVIVHAGRQEMEFCHASVGKLPGRMLDIQLAAGFAGLGYPLSHSSLVFKVLGATPRSLETRTNWLHRPLSDSQIEYALDDVRYLIATGGKLAESLESMGRLAWFQVEQQSQYSSTGEPFEARWRRIPGAGGLRPRALAVLREAANWRDDRARQLNKPPRWIVRDDLLAELAKRQPTTMDDLRSTRGLGFDVKAGWIKDLLAAIRRGVEMPDEDLPVPMKRKETPQEQMVVKILGAALMQRSREAGVATTLVGTNDDMHELLDWFRKGSLPETAPSLMQGWRGEVAGRYLCDLMAGRVVARIHTNQNEMVLQFEPNRTNET